MENEVHIPADRDPPIRQEDTDDLLPMHWRSGSLKYTDFKPLTRGGTAELKTCVDRNLNRVVVFKTLHKDLRDSEMETKRFLREARVTAMISHPGTVPLYELGRDREGALYFTMKKLAGRDLREILMDLSAKKHVTARDFPLWRLVDILIQACQTVAFAHEHGVIHRDLKPANILVGGFGEVMVLDWGLAKVKGEVEEISDEVLINKDKGEMGITRPGKRYGTPLYMSPEQARGDADIDERADIFNLGSILFEMLTWKNLLFGNTVQDVLTQVLESPTPVPSKVSPNRVIPPELEAICMQCLEKDPKDRYPSVKALIDDLQRYRDHRTVSVVVHAPLTHVWNWIYRHRVALTALGAAGIGAAATWLLMR